MAKKKARKRYSKKASETVAGTMRRRKRGSLKTAAGRTVKSRKQAIAIGLSEAREKGAKVPPPPKRTSARKRKSTS